MNRAKSLLTAIAALLLVAPATRSNLTIDWHAIDGGGVTSATGGSYTLFGTIGQHDAGPAMSGGSFQLVGGFWAAEGAPACACPADMNADGLVNGWDIQTFVNCYLAAGPDCECGDVDATPGVGTGDVAAFVTLVLQTPTCP